MGKAYLAYFSDYVLGAGGRPVAGATVSCYPVGAFAGGTFPSGGPPDVAAAASTTTDDAGQFVFPGIPPDDYHILIASTPPGGLTAFAWRYHVPVVAAEAVERAIATSRASCLPLTLARLAGGADVTIVAFGDDTTVGYDATGTTAGGWVALLAARLAASYPLATVVRADPNGYAATVDGPIPGWTATTLQAGDGPQIITLVNAGVRGDTVLRVLRRFANLSAAWPAADCLIVALGQGETTPGDPQRYVFAPDFASHLESLVNVTRSFTNAEILLCTPHANPPGTANFDDYADAVRHVAARTRCDLADIRQLWLDRYAANGPNDGYDPWLDSAASRLFPTDSGHAAIASELARHFLPGLALPYATAPYGAGKSWELVRVPWSSNQIGFSGSGWAAHGSFLGVALNSSGGSFEQITSHAGDSVRITGRFVDLSMLCRRWSDGGQVAVSIDGGTPRTVDLYRGRPASTSDLADANGASAPQDRVLLAHGLADTVHSAVMTLLAGQNPLSSGTVWRLESLELGRWRRQGYEVEAAEPQQRLQKGNVAVPLAGSSGGSVAVAFPIAYTTQSGAPAVVASSADPAYYCAIAGVTNDGFTLSVVRSDGTSVTASPACGWIAFG